MLCPRLCDQVGEDDLDDLDPEDRERVVKVKKERHAREEAAGGEDYAAPVSRVG